MAPSAPVEPVGPIGPIEPATIEQAQLVGSSLEMGSSALDAGAALQAVMMKTNRE
jgi:hypothetical protein